MGDGIITDLVCMVCLRDLGIPWIRIRRLFAQPPQGRLRMFALVWENKDVLVMALALCVNLCDRFMCDNLAICCQGGHHSF